MLISSKKFTVKFYIRNYSDGFLELNGPAKLAALQAVWDPDRPALAPIFESIYDDERDKK